MKNVSSTKRGFPKVFCFGDVVARIKAAIATPGGELVQLISYKEDGTVHDIIEGAVCAKSAAQLLTKGGALRKVTQDFINNTPPGGRIDVNAL